MATAVFYLSFKGDKGRQAIQLPNGRNVYIRAELIDTDDLGTALDCAAPYEDEWVMNSHPVPSEGE